MASWSLFHGGGGRAAKRPLEGQKSLKGEPQEILTRLLLNPTPHPALPGSSLIPLQPRVRIFCLSPLGRGRKRLEQSLLFHLSLRSHLPWSTAWKEGRQARPEEGRWQAASFRGQELRLWSHTHVCGLGQVTLLPKPTFLICKSGPITVVSSQGGYQD